MKISQHRFERHPFLNKEANDYLQDNPSLQNFRKYAPSLNSITEVIEDRKNFDPKKRETLVEVLTDQYKKLNVAPSHPIWDSINALKDKNTFTITTGQQIHIALGPMFFVYKIISCIHTAKQLQEKHPHYRFVPIFWMASEDNDFEEINYVKFYGQTFSWDDPQGGAVGRFSTKSLLPVIDEIAERLDDTKENQRFMELFRSAYKEFDNLAQATQSIIHQLFGDQGLIALEPDNAKLKAHFTETIVNDVVKNINYSPVDQASKALKESGYDLQINPQEVNHFYLTKNERVKIRKSDTYVLDNGEEWTEDEILAKIEESPADFSPNVVCRPMYQETILPNLIYIAGGSELRYWLQLKAAFEANNVFFPMVLPRSSAIVISDRTEEQITQGELEVKDLLMTEDELLALWNKEKGSETELLRSNIQELKEQLKSLPPDLQRIAPQHAPPLKHVGRAEKHIDSILEWIDELPPEVKNNDRTFKKILKVKRRFFDDQFPQERIEFCVNNLGFIQDLIDIDQSSTSMSNPKILNVFVTNSI